MDSRSELRSPLSSPCANLARRRGTNNQFDCANHCRSLRDASTACLEGRAPLRRFAEFPTWRHPPVIFAGAPRGPHRRGRVSGLRIDSRRVALNPCKRINHPVTAEFLTSGELSEDCLYLNVWTPARSPLERCPVFVYLHGGGYHQGSSSVPIYDGDGLSAKGLVVVTVNYRLGLLGFLAHPELTHESPYHASGNYGLLDRSLLSGGCARTLRHLAAIPVG